MIETSGKKKSGLEGPLYGNANRMWSHLYHSRNWSAKKSQRLTEMLQSSHSYMSMSFFLKWLIVLTLFSAQAEPAMLQVRWSKGILASLDGESLRKEKAKNGWISMASVAEDSLRLLSATEKSKLDWVILHLANAPQVWVPWAALKTLKLEVKVPELTLRVRSDGSAAALPYAGVAVWEGKRISDLEFGNVRDRLGPWFLSKRTDPIALRGEKLFVQGCASCHAQGNKAGLPELKTRLRSLTSQAFVHPPLDGIRSGATLPKLSEKDERALKTYIVVSD